jgi:hypothetical protein
VEIRTRQQGPARTAVALVRPPTVELAQAEPTRAARLWAARLWAARLWAVRLPAEEGLAALAVWAVRVASAEVVVMGASLDKAVLAE